MVIVGVLFIIVDFAVTNNKLELILSKEPEKCNKSELEWWMKYRGFLFKKSDTKAQLFNRVRHLSACATFTVMDPDPRHCHLLQKQIKRSNCKSRKQNSEENKIDKEDEKKKILLHVLSKPGVEVRSYTGYFLPYHDI